MVRHTFHHMMDYFGDNHIYTAHEIQRMVLSPINVLAEIGKQSMKHVLNPLAYTQAGRVGAAGFELLERMTRKFAKPAFGITATDVDGESRRVRVYEKVVMEKPFCDLIRFRKAGVRKQPKLLIVAPMSGHYATLCRGTVEGLLPYYDVYITDWQNASDVPVSEGLFDLDDYIDYLIEFIEKINQGSNLHVLAVCQPAVPVFAAVSLMNSQKNPKAPKGMILIGGPIDTRKNPTEVNRLAYEKSYEWFEQQVIARVPFNYLGYSRKVYPGFIQLSGFMQMNLDRHIEAHKNLFDHLVEGDGESADAHRTFYNEYLSVMDIPAEFYLQTIKTVFQEHSLPRGKMVSRGRPVRPQDVTKTACLAIEGERDDISGHGQTKAALSLLKNLPEEKKQYLFAKDVGHYGLFNGRRFRENIVPVIREFTKKNK